MKNLKKLGKLKLMPEKLLNQDELLSFRGGSGPGGGCNPGQNKYCCKSTLKPWDSRNWTCYAPSELTCKSNNPLGSSATTTCNQLSSCDDECTTYG